MTWAAGNKGKVARGENAQTGATPPQAPAWDTIAKMLECTVCFDSINGPIYQCSEGHLLCSLCWGRMNRPDAGCPTCSGVLGNIRCRFAESIRDACLCSCEAASPSGKAGGERKLPQAPRHSAVKKAAEAMGVGMEDLRSVMAREGVGLMEAVILAARTRVKGEIEESGGIDSYEKRKRESGRAAVVLDAAHKPAHSPRNPPRNPPAHRRAAETQAVTEAPVKASASAGTRAAPPHQRPIREDASEKQGPKAPARKDALASPRSERKKVPDAEPETVEEKYERYREEIRRQADAIFNEPDAVPEPKAKGLETKAKVPGASDAAGASAVARAQNSSASANASSHANAGLQLAYGSAPPAKTGARHADKAASQSTEPSPCSPSKPAASPKAMTRPVLNADVMAAYSSFRKDMRTKVFASARSSHDFTQASSTGPPEPAAHVAHASALETPSQGAVSLAGGQAEGGKSDQVGANEASQSEIDACAQEEAARSQEAVPTPYNGANDTQGDKRPLSAHSPASEDGNRARSEAATRSNSADHLLSPSCSAAGSSGRQTAGVASGAPSNATGAQRGVGSKEVDNTGHSLDNVSTGAEGKGAGDLSSLEKLRFPKIRTDIAAQQAQHHLAQCAQGPSEYIHSAGTQSAREAREIERAHSETERPRVLLAAPPPTSREVCPGAPPSTARSLRGGSRPGSSTPRDAVRAVMAGDRSGSGVWRIVAGVRNRLRVGPGK